MHINYLQVEGFLSFHFVTNILTEPLCQLPIPCLFLPKIRDTKLFLYIFYYVNASKVYVDYSSATFISNAVPQDQMGKKKKNISFSSDSLLKACLTAVQTCGVQLCDEWLRENVLQVQICNWAGEVLQANKQRLLCMPSQAPEPALRLRQLGCPGASEAGKVEFGRHVCAATWRSPLPYHVSGKSSKKAVKRYMDWRGFMQKWWVMLSKRQLRIGPNKSVFTCAKTTYYQMKCQRLCMW